MPSKPTINQSSTRKGPGGIIKSTMTGCATDSGVYIVYKVDLPTAVVAGAEDEQLKSQRDEFATEWKGKVLSEKKVRGENRVGLDFTIRGKPAEDSGILTIRVREFLIGKAIYAMMVVSVPNRELPEDAGRFLGSLGIGESRARAATPEPEPTGADLPGWGLALNPAKDCQIKVDGKKLVMQLPNTLHDLSPDSGVLNAPRVVRTVSGDFQVTVKVVGEFKPAGKSTNPKGVPYTGAGILVWKDADNFIRLERGALLRKEKLTAAIAFEEREGGYRGAVHNVTTTPGDCYLRLERHGSRIIGGVSPDGKAWKVLKPIDTVWPAKLKIGLDGITSSGEPFEVSFEDFTIKMAAGAAETK